jgi:hypothetical protein
MNKFHAMLSLFWDVNLPANTVIGMSRGFGGALRPADEISDLRVSEVIWRRADERIENQIYSELIGNWEP